MNSAILNHFNLGMVVCNTGESSMPQLLDKLIPLSYCVFDIKVDMVNFNIQSHLIDWRKFKEIVTDRCSLTLIIEPLYFDRPFKCSPIR
jgi:hypothetical protein